MTFLFMRHGETHANTQGILGGAPCTSDLTEKGRAQALAAAQTLKSRPPALLLVSPAPRTRQTAEIVRAHLGLPHDVVIEEPGILERHYGSWEGKPFLDFKEQFLKGETGEGGESLDIFRARIIAALDRLGNLRRTDVLAVSHGMVWQTLHDIHATPAPWIGNADVYHVTRAPFAATGVHVVNPVRPVD